MNASNFPIFMEYIGPFIMTSFVMGMILGGIIIGSIMYKGKGE